LGKLNKEYKILKKPIASEDLTSLLRINWSTVIP